MKPADLALLRVPGVPTVSPDGRRAVVAVNRLDLEADEYRSELWLVETDGSAEARPITGGPRDTAPRWSPDGRWLAFRRAASGGRPQLQVLPVGLGEPRALTDHPLGAGQPVWSPDSTRIAYVTRVPEEGRYGTREGVTAEKESPRRITTLNYRLDNVGFTLDRRQHVFVVDPTAGTPAPEQITAGDYDDEQVTWTPDGTRLVFVSTRHPQRDTTLYSDVYSCARDGSDVCPLTRTTLRASFPVVVSGGHDVAFLGSELGPDGRDFAGRPDCLWLVPVDGSAAPRAVAGAEDLDLVEQDSGLVATADGVLVAAQRAGAVELLHIRLDGSGAVETLVNGDRQVIGYAAAVAADRVVATVADPTSAGELVVLTTGGAGRSDSAGGAGKSGSAGGAGKSDSAGREATRTSFGAELTGRGGLRPMREVRTAAGDGYPVHGWVVHPDPAAFPGPRPVLLTIHGGPQAQYGWTLFDEAQVYAGAGYAVVMGNPRGSAGYGLAHARAIRHALGTLDADDLLALLDAALADPGLDAGRVGVMGGSYGGFMASWLAGHAGARFRAAISERAVNAFDSMTGSSDIGHFFTEGYVGAEPAAVAGQSPLSYADQINLPVLLIHSEQDWRCPVEQAQRLFVALRTRGVEAELLLFPGEGHELSRSGLPSHRVARFDAILDWWSRHLAERPAGSPP